jgi:hypothetical protein
MSFFFFAFLVIAAFDFFKFIFIHRVMSRRKQPDFLLLYKDFKMKNIKKPPNLFDFFGRKKKVL